jgi:hypothetical protein
MARLSLGRAVLIAACTVLCAGKSKAADSQAILLIYWEQGGGWHGSYAVFDSADECKQALDQVHKRIDADDDIPHAYAVCQTFDASNPHGPGFEVKQQQGKALGKGSV